MISSSDEERECLFYRPQFYLEIDCPADGRSERIETDRIAENGLTIDEATSSTSTFEVGAAIMSQITVKLLNYDGYFDDWNFTDAEVRVVLVAIDESGNAIGELLRGRYIVQNPDSYPSVIELTALDFMSGFERDFSGLTEQIDIASMGAYELLDRVCNYCGVSFGEGDVKDIPILDASQFDDSTTCLDVVSYIAQASGKYAKISENGELCLRWYSMEELLGGGRDAIYLDYPQTLTVNTDDVVITGISVTGNSLEDDSKTETVTLGTDDYMLTISDNPLAVSEADGPNAICDTIMDATVGQSLQFRPFTATAMGSPLYEAGDPICVIDSHERKYLSFITSYKYTIRGACTYTCSAESAARNSAASYSAATKAYQKALQKIHVEKTAREVAIQNLQDAISDSTAGLFSTITTSSGGASIYYLHDQKTIAESKIIWKMTSEAVAVSTNGGKSYTTGLTATGTAILNRIYTIGLDAQYITTGRISDTKNYNYWDLSSGELVTTNGKIGGFTIGSDSIYSDEVILSSSGIMLKQDGSLMGNIGSGYLVSDPSVIGLGFHLTAKGNYMTWAAKDSDDDESYLMSVTFVNKGYTDPKVDRTYEDNTLYLDCNTVFTYPITFKSTIDGQNHPASNFYIDPDTGGASGGMSKTYTLTVMNDVTSDGSYSFANDCYLKFKHGLLVGSMWSKNHVEDTF